MSFAPIPVPDEIIEIHRPLDLFDPFRATTCFEAPKQLQSFKLRCTSRGFISQNENSFAFTTLSTLMDLGIYGMNRVIRKVSRGAKIDNAIQCLQQQPLSKRAVRLIQFFGGKAVSVVVVTSHACAGDTDSILFRGQRKCGLEGAGAE